MQNKDLHIYQGDTHRFRLDLSSGGYPLDLSKANLLFTVMTVEGSKISPSVAITERGVVIDFSAAQTATFDWVVADYDFRAAFGDVVKTYLRGKIHVTPSIGKLSAGEGSDGLLHDETVEIAVAPESVVIHTADSKLLDHNVITRLEAEIEALRGEVKAAEESAEIAALSERLDLAQAAIASAGTLAQRLTDLENAQSKLSSVAQDLAAQRLELEGAINRAVQSDTEVTNLKQQLDELRQAVNQAEESAEIEEINNQISSILPKLEEAKRVAAESANPAALESLRAKVTEMEGVVRQQSETASEVAALRALLKKPKREKIHLPQAIWADGGYTWAEVSFSQEYTDPKIHIQLEHLKRLPVLFLTLNLSAKTSRGVFVRSNMAKEKIDVEYSVYLYVEEMADT